MMHDNNIKYRLSSALLVLLVLLINWPMHLNAQSREKILVSVSDLLGVNDVLYSMNPDGSALQKLFDFSNHPKHQGGRILYPRVSKKGLFIFFSSDNAYAYTPAGYNLFKISADGNAWEQLTPGPHSGNWKNTDPDGVVEGIVTGSDDYPLGNAPIFLEGMDMITSRPDGTFRFDRVPQGERWIVAYRPGLTVFDAQLITVAHGTISRVDFKPVSDYRIHFYRPVPFEDRIYYILGANKIQWTPGHSSMAEDIYSAYGIGTGVTDVDGFDVSPTTGTLAVMDYQDGCPTNRGLYLTDKDGGSLRLLVDMKVNYNWCGAQEVFWSPDETKLAFKGCYNWYTWFFIYDASNGMLLGSIYFSDQNMNLYNTSLHGWSPDGKWLLYAQYLNDPVKGSLFKVRVQENGSIDMNSVAILLNNTSISGATWGALAGE